jgi:hypothetical protein
MVRELNSTCNYDFGYQPPQLLPKLTILIGAVKPDRTNLRIAFSLNWVKGMVKDLHE